MFYSVTVKQNLKTGANVFSGFSVIILFKLYFRKYLEMLTLPVKALNETVTDLVYR